MFDDAWSDYDLQTRAKAAEIAEVIRQEMHMPSSCVYPGDDCRMLLINPGFGMADVSLLMKLERLYQIKFDGMPSGEFVSLVNRVRSAVAPVPPPSPK